MLLAALRETSGFGLGLIGAVLVLLYATLRALQQPVESESWLQFTGVATAAIAVSLAVGCRLLAQHRSREDRTLQRGFAAAVAIGSLVPGCMRW